MLPPREMQQVAPGLLKRCFLYPRLLQRYCLYVAPRLLQILQISFLTGCHLSCSLSLSDYLLAPPSLFVSPLIQYLVYPRLTMLPCNSLPSALGA